MARNQDMNEDNFLNRIKSADPAATVELDEQLIDRSIDSGNRKAKATRKRNTFLAAAGSGVLALSVFANMSLGTGNQTGLITLGVQQGVQNAEGSPADSRAAAPMTSDKMMMINPFIYQYVAGAGLSDQGSSGRVYKVELDGEADRVMANLMKVFGVKGLTQQTIDVGAGAGGYQMLSAGEQDGLSKTLNLSWIGSGSWWYYNPSAYPQSECTDWQTSEDDQRYCAIYAEQKPTPELVPTAAEAKSQAVRIFKSVGFNVAASDIRVSADQWGAWASASVQLNGEDTPIEYSISWSSNGELASVSGHSMKFVDKGEFKTVSPKQAVSRLSDWRYNASIASSAYDKYFPQNSQVMPLGSEPTTKDLGTPEISIEPIAEPTPTTVVVEVNKSVKTHVMIWDAAGNNWLVPGYIFIGDGSYISPVFALEDGIVALPPKE